MAIAIYAVLCGARSYAAIAQWAKHRTQKQLRRLWSRYDEKKGRYIPPWTNYQTPIEINQC